MASKCAAAALWAIALTVCAPGRAADPELASGRWLTIDFPRDSPVLPVSFAMGSSTAKIRGTSMVMDLHASVVLRNVGSKTLSGLTMRVDAQDLQAGKGSVTVPSVSALPGETFPVRVDMEIVRPVATTRAATASLVQLSLDCALFSDLTSYGPDALHARRSLMVYELQARREREYLALLLRTQQWARLRDELNFGLPESYPPRMGLEFVPGPRPAMHEQPLAVSPVSFSGAPVQPIGGGAQVAGNEVRSPHVEVRRLSSRNVRSMELGWIVRDERGHDFIAGSIPINLSAEMIQSVQITNSAAALRFSNGMGQPMIIGALRAFVNDVEFSDGSVWIPSRSDIDNSTSDPVLRHELASSPEQQHLAKVYRLRGTAGLAEELKRTN